MNFLKMITVVPAKWLWNQTAGFIFKSTGAIRTAGTGIATHAEISQVARRAAGATAVLGTGAAIAAQRYGENHPALNADGEPPPQSWWEGFTRTVRELFTPRRGNAPLLGPGTLIGGAVLAVAGAVLGPLLGVGGTLLATIGAVVGVLGGQALLNAANEKPDSRSPSAGGGTTTTTTSKAAPATESTHTGQLTPPSTPPVARATPPRGMAQPNQQAGTGIV